MKRSYSAPGGSVPMSGGQRFVFFYGIFRYVLLAVILLVLGIWLLSSPVFRTAGTLTFSDAIPGLAMLLAAVGILLRLAYLFWKTVSRAMEEERRKP
jgi:hypothetical protein